MQWKPFLYNFSIGVSLGASYRWDFFPFFKTFKVELGADLELWGPPFGGKVHISWWVISFTISFGTSRPTADPIKWKDFADTFLHTTQQAKNETGEKLIQIQASQGVIREQNGLILMDSDHMRLEVTSQMMCTSVRFGQKEIAKYTNLGILPMNVTSFNSVMTVELIQLTKSSRTAPADDKSSFCVEALCQNVPKALWASSKPAQNSTEMLLKEVPCGMTILCQPKDAQSVLPLQGFYDMDVLCRNERLKPHSCSYTTPARIPSVDYPKDKWQTLIETTIGKMNSTRKEILVSGWTASLDQMLYAPPSIATIGANAQDTQRQSENLYESHAAQMTVRAPRLFLSI